MSALPPSTPLDDVPSPCLKQCKVVHRRLVKGEPMTSLCASCGRTVAEITTWRDMAPAHKRACVEAAQARRQWLGLTAR